LAWAVLLGVQRLGLFTPRSVQAQVIAVYVVEKGKPLVQSAQ